MNIVLATSDLYSKLALVTLESLFINNKCKEITIYYIGNKLTVESKTNIQNLVDSHGRNVCFIDMPEDMCPIAGLLRKDPIVYSYCYLSNLLPSTIDKALLIESDVIVTGNIDGLYNLDINNFYLAASDDMQSKFYKKKLGMKSDSPYFNSGIMLVNLKKWRENNVPEELTKVIAEGTHKFFYEVQDEMNTFFEGKVKIFHPKYNCTTSLFLFDYKNMIRYRRPSTFCSRKDFEDAINNPSLVHFTTNQIVQCRPWIIHCDHPYSDYYENIKDKTVLKDMPLWDDSRGKMSVFVNHIYKHFSKTFVAIAIGIVHAYLYPLFLYKHILKSKT